MQVTGTIVIRKNGRSLLAKSDATMSLGGKERTDQYADHGLVGYAEKPIAASISGKGVHHAGVSLQDIMDTVDATMSFETDTGVTYTIRNAFATKPPELTGGEGEFTFEFKGHAAVQS